MPTLHSLTNIDPPSPLGILSILPLEVRDRIYNSVLANNDGWWNQMIWLHRKDGFDKVDLDARVLLECLPLMKTSKQIRRECLETFLREPDMCRGCDGRLENLLTKPDGIRLYGLLKDLRTQCDLSKHTRRLGVVMQAMLIQPLWHDANERWIPDQINKLRRCFDAFKIPSSRYFLDLYYGNPTRVTYDYSFPHYLDDLPWGTSQRPMDFAEIYCVQDVTVKLWMGDADASTKALDKACEDMDELMSWDRDVFFEVADNIEGTDGQKADLKRQIDEGFLLVSRNMGRLREYHISWIRRMEVLWDGYYDVADFFNMVESTNQT
ncbi:unnamed protein product [Aureobasidium vineae]|uniref:Uncharacterized protein n=1 Tax=Aureobasidium vineae TaxID=2773715 RepID=A0A9N8JPJ6_9PEZI|nr:unnamed protein product [Aureobasidium vineae]